MRECCDYLLNLGEMVYIYSVLKDPHKDLITSDCILFVVAVMFTVFLLLMQLHLYSLTTDLSLKAICSSRQTLHISLLAINNKSINEF